MSAQSVGRRGLKPELAQHVSLPTEPVTVTPRIAAAPALQMAPDNAMGVSAVLDYIPIVTMSLIILFVLGYGYQHKIAFDIDSDGSLSLQSLIAQGAVGYDLVFRQGEWWRVFLAPLLHSSLSHQIGNCIALFFVGFRLEAMVGRAWFFGIFMVSALGGVAGSLLGNPHAVVTVGASGAITGLIGALFIASFHHKADELGDQAAMRKTALRFGIPALAPLLYVKGGHTDYFAHGGGALTGAIMAIILCLVWHSDERRPRMGSVVALLAVIYLQFSGAAAWIARSNFAVQRAVAADFIPAADVPKRDADMTPEQSGRLVRQYPKDPRAHMIRAVSLLHEGDLRGAEPELRQTIDLAGTGPYARLRQVAEPILARVLAKTGRRDEGKRIAKESCATDDSEIRELVAEDNLCN